jgi:ArsR family transcriptional regulator, arsenate/arsenite/antimonite-responsive transcriptional repressor
METEESARLLEALGNPTRLAIYCDLVEAGADGRSVGEVNEQLGIPASTLSHHINKLVQTGLITQQRISRTLVCRAESGKMDELVLYLAHNCCAEDSAIWG